MNRSHSSPSVQSRYDHELVRQRKVEKAADIQAATEREAVVAHMARFEQAAQEEIAQLSAHAVQLEKDLASRTLELSVTQNKYCFFQQPFVCHQGCGLLTSARPARLRESEQRAAALENNLTSTNHSYVTIPDSCRPCISQRLTRTMSSLAPLYRIQQSETRVAGLGTDLAAANEKITSLEEALSTASGRVQTLEKEHHEAIAVVKDKHDKIFERRHGRSAESTDDGPVDAKQVVADLQAQVAWLLTVADDRDALSDETQRLTENVKAMADDNARLNREKTDLARENGLLAEDNTALANEIQAFRGDDAALRRELAEAEQGQADAMRQATELRRQLESTLAELDETQTELRIAAEDLQGAREAHHSLADALLSTRECVCRCPLIPFCCVYSVSEGLCFR